MTETRPASSARSGQPGGRPSISLFFRQVVAELRKVIWPTRDQLTTYFTVVLIFVCFMIVVVSVLDYVFNMAMFKIFG